MLQEIQQQLYSQLDEFAAQKEQLIMDLLNDHFGHAEWTQEQAAEVIEYDTYVDGREFIKVGDKVIEFTRLQTDLQAGDGHVYFQFHQFYQIHNG